MKLASGIAKEPGVDVYARSAGGGGGGGEADWRFQVGFYGDEADRAEFMRILEQRIDEALDEQGIEVSGSGFWSGLPGFRKSYHTTLQRGFLSV